MEIGREFSRQNTSPPADEAAVDTIFHSRRSRCCGGGFFPCFDRSGTSSAGPTWWQKVRPADTDGGGSLWARGVGALRKIREWSEIVAGPRWKTFIRRFGRNRSGTNRHANFQYDPLSYAMNFDEGPGQNGHFEGEADDDSFSRNFSSRYAKGSMDLGKDGPNFV